MRGLFVMAFLRAFAELERRKNRKRQKKRSATERRQKITCAVCRAYGGKMKKFGSGYICRKCEKERENETRNDG